MDNHPIGSVLDAGKSAKKVTCVPVPLSTSSISHLFVRNHRLEPMSRCILVRGLRGSGTHALATTILSGHSDPRFTLHGQTIVLAASGRGCFTQTEATLGDGTNVVVHGTFHQNWQIDPYRWMVRAGREIEIEIVDLFDAGLDDETLAQRCSGTLQSIRKMRAQWETLAPTDLDVENYGTRLLKSSRKRWLHLVRGLPASGKASRAKNIVSGLGEFENESVVLSIHDCTDFNVLHKRVEEALRRGLNVVVPDVCPNWAWWVSGFRSIADECGVVFEVTDLGDGGCSDEELVARSNHGATLALVRSIRRTYEPSDRDSDAWKAWSLARQREHEEHMAQLQQSIDNKMNSIRSKSV